MASFNGALHFVFIQLSHTIEYCTGGASQSNTLVHCFKRSPVHGYMEDSLSQCVLIVRAPWLRLLSELITVLDVSSHLLDARLLCLVPRGADLRIDSKLHSQHRMPFDIHRVSHCLFHDV